MEVDIREYAKQVKHLLARQKVFFKTKDRTVLQECKDLEKNLMQITEKILNPINQEKLFL